MYGSQAWVDPLPYICLLFSGFSNVCQSAAFWPTDLKLGCITNFDMLFLMMGLISLVDEIQFMLISSRHFSNRSIRLIKCSHVVCCWQGPQKHSLPSGHGTEVNSKGKYHFFLFLVRKSSTIKLQNDTVLLFVQ